MSPECLFLHFEWNFFFSIKKLMIFSPPAYNIISTVQLGILSYPIPSFSAARCRLWFSFYKGLFELKARTKKKHQSRLDEFSALRIQQKRTRQDLKQSACLPVCCLLARDPWIEEQARRGYSRIVSESRQAIIGVELIIVDCNSRTYFSWSTTLWAWKRTRRAHTTNTTPLPISNRHVWPNTRLFEIIPNTWKKENWKEYCNTLW